MVCYQVDFWRVESIFWYVFHNQGCEAGVQDFEGKGEGDQQERRTILWEYVQQNEKVGFSRQ